MIRPVFVPRILLVLLFVSMLPTTWAQGELVSQPFRISNLDIKIVFVGFDRSKIDLDYMKWLLPSYDTWLDVHVNFTFSYTFLFAPESFKRSFSDYLKSVQDSKEGRNPFLEKETTNYFYDANKLEEWLYNNRAGYGGLPQNGYSAIVSNLEDLPIPHYYRTSYRDIDFGGSALFARSNWMIGWGGHYRFYYIDMSAGPHSGSVVRPAHEPLWRFGEVSSRYDVIWLTTYLSQVIEEILWNLFEPSPLYGPRLSDRYQIAIFVLDDDTGTDLGRTVKEGVVKRAFEELVPYATWEVKTTFASIRKYPALYQVFLNSYDEGDNAYAIQPIQNYIEQHLQDFFRTESGVVVLPAFAFVLKQDREMGSLEKWKVYTWLGLAPGSAVYTAISAQKYIKEYGLGFTQTIVHELGHFMGLKHPHHYGASGTFVASAMSYTQNEYAFSVFNKDFVARTHANIVLSVFENVVQQVEAYQLQRSSSRIKDMLEEVKRTRARSLQAYNSMDYQSALQQAKKGLTDVGKVLEEAKKPPTLTERLLEITGFPLESIILGMALGISLVILYGKRRHALEPSSGPSESRTALRRKRISL